MPAVGADVRSKEKNIASVDYSVRYRMRVVAACENYQVCALPKKNAYSLPSIMGCDRGVVSFCMLAT